jgi:hypothetical protein
MLCHFSYLLLEDSNLLFDISSLKLEDSYLLLRLADSIYGTISLKNAVYSIENSFTTENTKKP